VSERILCAAIWIDDGIRYVHQPVTTGFVIGGWRHHNCINAAQQTVAVADEAQRAGRNQGFITSQGRYVDRDEAFTIAQAAGQLDGRHIHTPGSLWSEDLY
jgi:hypothetical protein